VTTVVIAGDDVSRKKLTRVGGRNVLEWQREASSYPKPLTPILSQTNDPGALPPIPYESYLIGLTCLLIGVVAIARKPARPWLWAPAIVIGGCATWYATHREPPELSDADAVALFRELHANMYQSFSRRTEESTYDALSHSVDGDLLREIYLEVRRGLVMQDQGGATATIRDVELVDVDRIRGSHPALRSFRLQCRWNVSGTVEHWGHRHQRTNQYNAEFVVASTDGCWKLLEMDLVDERRLSSETTLRSL
jgi:hypothetical protein